MTKEDWEFTIGLFFALLAFLGVDVKFVREKFKNEQRRTWFLRVVIALSMIFSAWGWYRIHELHQRVPFAEYQSPQNQQGAIVSYGMSGNLTGFVDIDGNAVMDHADNYRLAAVVFHNPGYDELDINSLSVSTLHDIVPSTIRITIELSDKYKQESQAMLGVNFIAVLVPKTVMPNQFSTLRQAQAMGAIIVGKGQASASASVITIPGSVSH